MTIDTLHIVLLVIALAASAIAFVFAQRKPPNTEHLTAELGERSKEIAALKSEVATQRQRAEAAEKAEAGVRASLQASEAKVAEAKTASTALTQQLAKLQAEHAQALAEAARNSEREASFAREKEQLQKMQVESEKRFQSLAEQALLKSQQQFVQIADETLKKHKEGAEGELGKMLKPISDTFSQFQKKVDEIQKMSAEDRAKLEEQIRGVSESVRKTESAAGKLAARFPPRVMAAAGARKRFATCSKCRVCHPMPISPSRTRPKPTRAASGRMSSSACPVDASW